MSVTLIEVAEAARLRRASLVSELCGYLTLGVADACAAVPRLLESAELVLLQTGQVEVRGGEACDARACAEGLRCLLGDLLAQSRTISGSLSRLAAPDCTLKVTEVIVAIEAALIPVNRQAARRALGRLYREVMKARDAGHLGACRPAAVEGSLPSALVGVESHFAPRLAHPDTSVTTVAPAPLATSERAPVTVPDTVVQPPQFVASETPRLPEATVRIDTLGAPGDAEPVAVELSGERSSCVVEPAGHTVPLAIFASPPTIATLSTEPEGTVPLAQYLRTVGQDRSLEATVPLVAPQTGVALTPSISCASDSPAPVESSKADSRVMGAASCLSPDAAEGSLPAFLPSCHVPTVLDSNSAAATAASQLADVVTAGSDESGESLGHLTPAAVIPEVGVPAASHFPGRRSTVEELVGDFVVGTMGFEQELRRELQSLAGVDASLTPPPVRAGIR
jgi:hypothetical protein